MSKDFYQEELRGTRQAALEVVQKIEADLKRYGSSGRRDAHKHQIMFTYNVLMVICRSCESLRVSPHYDIYVDLYTEVLAPQLEPAASPSHWKRLLPLVEYLFLKLAANNFYAEAYKLYTYVSKTQLEWPDLDDFMYLLNIHGSQLHMLIKQNETTTENTIKERVVAALSALTVLFQEMIQRHREKPTDYTTLLRSFMNSIITKRSSIQIPLATTMQCTQLKVMYTKFFELLRVNSEFVSSEDSSTRFQLHTEALYQFLQMDLHSELQQQLALPYARIVCQIGFKENKFMTYCCTLLCNLLKLAYVRERINNFKECYTKLTNKFSSCLASSGEVLIREVWFQDFIFLLYFLFSSIHTSGNEVFDVFWQQMDASDHVAHIKMIAELHKKTRFIIEIKAIQFKCCKNPNSFYHIQLNCAQIALETFMRLLKLHKSASKEETSSEIDLLSTIKTEISTILQNSIDTLIEMENECTKSATTIRKFCVTFAKLLQEGKHLTHSSCLFSLATDMIRLKSRISFEDWIMIMCRVDKIASICKADINAAEIHSCYIAELICKPKQSDFKILQSVVQFHHQGTPGNCLFDIYAQSTSPFKPLLQKHEKRIFHWIEMQSVRKFYDKEKDRALFMTLAQRSQTKYDFINAVHAGKLLAQTSMSTKVQNIYDMLRNSKITCEKSGSASFTRLQELTLAHTICLLLFKRLEDQKVTMSIKDFQESNFAQLFQEKSLLSLSFTKEMEMTDMALEAFHAFEAFFNRADVEQLDSNDGYFLDWMRILEDLVSIAFYFQTFGNLDHALKTWLLHYRIANTIDDVQSSLRSLAFFCEHNMLLENDTHLNLAEEVDKKYDSLNQILDNLPQLLRREQNFTLNCLSQIAYLYASQKRVYEARTLINLVKHLHKNKLERSDSYDIVLFTADIVNFRILWKHMSPEELIDSEPSTSREKESSSKDRCVLQEVDVVLERLRTYVQISSADIQPYTLLLLKSIEEFVEFGLNRLCASSLTGFLSSAFKLCVENGMAIRTAQLLLKWVSINLQMEYLQKAEIKMQFAECILGVRDFKELTKSLEAAKSCAVAASKQFQDEHEYGISPVGLEEVRRVAVLSTPSLMKEKIHEPLLMAFDHKLESCHQSRENTKSQRLNELVLWCRFELSCFRARFNFLSSHYKDLKAFYDNCDKWLGKRKHTFHFQVYQSTVLVCMQHRANFLRANKDYEKAMKHLKVCIGHVISLEGKVDSAYLNNFELQLRDTELELLECKTRNLPVKKTLHVLSSVSDKPEKTPAAKPNKYAALPMTTCKKSSSISTLKNAAFVIYSDRKSPRRGHVKHTKLLAGVKGLKFESSSSSGNESSAERKKGKKQNFNTCQLIEISDSDSDLEVDKSKDSKLATEKTKSSTKLPKQSKFKLKFLDSIELEDLAPSKTPVSTKVNTVKSTKIQRKENSKDELVIVNEMQNLAIDSMPTTSKTGTTEVRTLCRSPRLGTKMDKSPVSTTPILQIDLMEEESPLLPNVARKRNTKRNKTPQPSSTVALSMSETKVTSNRLETSEIRTRTRRLHTPTTLSLRSRQRN